MSEITLKNVGPIQNTHMELNNGIIMVIGEQASGKSTLAKEVYFFKKIRDYFLDYLCNSENFIYESVCEQYVAFLKYIRSNYMESFGTTKHFPRDYCIEYVYVEEYYVTVTLDKKSYVKFRFSPKLEAGIKVALEAVRKIYKNNVIVDKDIYNSFIFKQKMREEITAHFTTVARELFEEEGEIVYIPAARSMLSVLSEQIDVVDVKGLDLPMRDFVQMIRKMKSKFAKKLDDVVADYLKTVKGQIKNKDVSLAQTIIKQVLRGDYISDTDGEKLFVDEKNWVKLIYSSSGQQEVLWILNILFISILENKKAFFVIEEPEAHLFPYAQKYLMELIALTHNSNGSQMLITTHSPYILTSTNLLAYSGIVENGNNINNSVVEKKKRLEKGSLRAYRFRREDQESIKEIMDEDGILICTSEIDEVSDLINDETDRLIKMEVDSDLQ